MLAQPFRSRTAPPEASSREAQQLFQTKIEAQARLLAGHHRLGRVSENKRQKLVEFVVGNVLFAAVHEIGLAFLSDKALPTIGGLEQGADDFAILTVLELGKKDFLDRVLMQAAKGWFTHARRNSAAKIASDYYDQHDFNQRRAYRMVCLMVGADAVRFKALVAETALPNDLQRNCGWDYDQLSRLWENVLTPYRPGADQPKARIEVGYRAVERDLEIVFREVFRNLRFLEIIAEFAADRLTWKAPLSMEMRACGGGAVTSWTATSRTLQICYEMAEDLTQLYLAFGQDDPR